MAVEVQNGPYFAMVKGEPVRLSNLYKYAEYAVGFVDLMMREGSLVGQWEMFHKDGSISEDMILYYHPKGSQRVAEELKSHEIKLPNARFNIKIS